MNHDYRRGPAFVQNDCNKKRAQVWGAKTKVSPKVVDGRQRQHKYPLPTPPTRYMVYVSIRVGRRLPRPARRTHPANVAREVGLSIDHDVTPVVDCSTLRSAEVVLRGVCRRVGRVRQHDGEIGTKGGRRRGIWYVLQHVHFVLGPNRFCKIPLIDLDAWERRYLETARCTSHRFSELLRHSFYPDCTADLPCWIAP